MSGTRDQIISVADRLIYRQGYEHTSFAQLAEAVNISRGNFYHHFKSKDEILDAVIDLRLENTRQLLQQWETANSDPAGRIKCYIRIVLGNWSLIRLHGCPVGTLCTELAKLDHLAQHRAAEVFTLFRQWLQRQFRQLGCTTAQADAHAMHVLAWSQGVATMGNTFKDEKFVRQQVRQLCRWVDELRPQQQDTH